MDCTKGVAMPLNAVGDAGRAGRRAVVGRELVEVVEGERLILLDAALLPIPEHRQPEVVVREVVRPRPIVVGLELPHVGDVERAVRIDRGLPDELRDGTSRLHEELSERQPEPRRRRREGREGQRNDVVADRRKAGPERPREVPGPWTGTSVPADLDTLVLEHAAIGNDRSRSPVDGAGVRGRNRLLVSRWK